MQLTGKIAYALFVFTALVVPSAALAQNKGIDPKLQSKAQDGKQKPYLEFGGARVSLGMTVGQVERSLAAAGRNLKFLNDGRTTSGMTEQDASVTLNNVKEPNGDEGQVTFYNGRVGYAAFQFSGTRDAVVLAQELAGAIENVDARNCSLNNFTAHGTGGGHSDSIFTCGSKTIRVSTIEPLGDDRSTSVEIEIGTTTPDLP